MTNFEVETDGRTVWVSGSNGECVGRFSKYGVDVHRDYEAQIKGEPQCLDCCHDLPFDESWVRF